MAIENRNPEAGTRLVATYKKQAFVCTVERDGEGNARYRLEDAREFRSPSAAGSAVMGGTACNGWRFWSVEGEAPAKAPAKGAASNGKGRRPAKKTRRPGKRIIRRTANQTGLPEGEVRWYCDACMRGFSAAEADGAPDVCPEGHRVDDPRFNEGSELDGETATD